MKNNERNGDQNVRTGQNSQDDLRSQENNESLNTGSQQPNESLRNAAAGSGRSYDYGVPGSQQQEESDISTDRS